MFQKIITTVLLMPLSFSAQVVNGMIDLTRRHSASQTADNLENILKPKDMIFRAETRLLIH